MKKLKWKQGPESNRQPPGYEPGALPLRHPAVVGPSCGVTLLTEDIWSQVVPCHLAMCHAFDVQATLRCNPRHAIQPLPNEALRDIHRVGEFLLGLLGRIKIGFQVHSGPE